MSDDSDGEVVIRCRTLSKRGFYSIAHEETPMSQLSSAQLSSAVLHENRHINEH